jgi:hypothetical protein
LVRTFPALCRRMHGVGTRSSLTCPQIRASASRWRPRAAPCGYARSNPIAGPRPADQWSGVFTARCRDRRRECRPPPAIDQNGQLERVGRGACAATEQLAAARPWAAFAIRSRGFVMSRTKVALAAGRSAVALRGLPCIGAPPALPTAVHPSRTGSGAQRTRYGVVYPRDLPCEHHGSYAGCPIVGAAWMAVDLARSADRTAHSSSRTPSCTPEQL